MASAHDDLPILQQPIQYRTKPRVTACDASEHGTLALAAALRLEQAKDATAESVVGARHAATSITWSSNCAREIAAATGGQTLFPTMRTCALLVSRFPSSTTSIR